MFAQSKGGNYGLTNGASGVADAIDFDGATDYLSRSTDLVGNADGKTFTFSAWVWNAGGYGCIYSNNDQSGDSHGITIRFDSTSLYIFGGTGGGGAVLNWFTANFVPKYTWFHVLISIDLANSANRFVFINDVSVSSTPSTYANSNIDFTRTQHNVGSNPYGLYSNQQRFSNIYLDYTYRDLSIEANRRLFITADRKPAANQAALNPILYLPLNDPTQPGKNLGTGGDFTLNGVVARSGRGPSQFNAPYSDLDGSADYLSRTTALTGAVAGKAFTLEFCFNCDAIQGSVFCIGTSDPFDRVLIRLNSSGRLNALAYNSTGATVLGCSLLNVSFVSGRNYVVVMTIDLSDVAKRCIYVNGVAASVTYTTYTNDTIPFDSNRIYVSRSTFGTDYVNGRLSNVFFDTKYIDLSQPANLAKFVTGTGIDAKPADLGANGEKPFGTPPLIYLPMYGNNAGKNYGTGGDFTVNSGPFLGVRGPNEYWGNKVVFSSGSSLGRTSALTISNSKTLSFSFFIDAKTQTESRIFVAETNVGEQQFYIGFSGTYSQLRVYSPSVLGVLAQGLPITNDSGKHHVCFCLDMDVYNGFYCYIDGVQHPFTTNTYTTGATITLNRPLNYIGSDAGSQYMQSHLSEFYFTTEYIDFSQEANRLKFRDAFGNPVDLAPQIAAGTLPNPAIYMRFDPDNFGKNYGTGGDFTVNGTITDGGQL